jgi:predicted esterase
MTSPLDQDPHANQAVVTIGPGVEASRAVMIMLHGRNAEPRSILELVPTIRHPGFTFLAPAASGRTWYPKSFLSETAQNEPGLSSGLRSIDRLVREVVDLGVPRRRIILLGFSQGGCLTAEYAVRHAVRYGGVVVLSGGLIGPPGTSWNRPGAFENTPIFLGCSDTDPHVPRERVDESAEVFRGMGAAVTERIYPAMGHQVNDDELAFTRAMMASVAATD